jgi:VRR-NUC domain
VNPIPPAMSEDDLLSGLLELMSYTGWRAYHVRRSDRAVVMGAGGRGFPDIIAVHPEGSRLVAIECKSDRGVPTPDQLAWIFAFRHHPTIEATIVRPSTYDAAIAWIRGTGPMPAARRLDPLDS